MTDTTAVPERVAESARRSRRGGVSGHQTVGDYLGRPAGEAAQAVRRIGLRPGLDRSFGCAAELVGLVVAQDPAAGSDLARNGMVTLFVAAPGGDPADEDTAVAVDAELVQTADEPGSEAPRVARRPRRRKQGLASHTAGPPEPVVVPAAARVASASGELVQPTVQPTAAWPVAARTTDGVLENDLDGELPGGECPDEDDELVVQVEDVLAGRSGPRGWRGAYPRRRGALHECTTGRRVRGWLAEHRLVAGVVAVSVVLWIVVGVASTLESGHARNPVSAVVAKPTQHVRDRRSVLGLPAARKSIARGAPARPTRTLSRRAASPAAPRSTLAPALVVHVVREADARGAAERQEVPAPQTSGPPVSTTSAPAAEQSGGGLFSP